jgi:uncharacterized protein
LITHGATRLSRLDRLGGRTDALDMELEGYVEAWRKRFARDVQMLAEQTEQARAAASRAAAELKREFGARRVWLVGSLARGRFAARSDIDLIAEGLPPALLFKATARARDMTGAFELDLAPLEDLRPRARRDLELHGVPL